MASGFLKVPWFVWGLFSLVVALVFVFVVPNAARVNALEGVRFLIVRWFHSLCWVLLGLSFFMRGTRFEPAAQPVAIAGGIVYLIYILVFITSGSS